VATELGSAYVSVWAETSKLETQIKAALDGSGKYADRTGSDIGKRISDSASKALKDGWRPDQDIMAGIPDTKLDRIGAHIGQVIGRSVVVGMRANEAGRKFADGFSDGAGSVGMGKVIASWRSELAANGALKSVGMLAGKGLAVGLTAGVGTATAGIGAVVGLIGTALTGGFKRLEALDTAKQKLLALKLSASDVQKTMDAVKSAVEGTPYALDAAFTVATQAIAGNVTDIKGYITAIADSAAFAKVDFADMGDVFNDILNKGKVTGEELGRLQAKGVPAQSWIQESYKLTANDYDKLQREGKISLDMLQKSIEDHAPGMAKAGATTIGGAIDQMKTALSRLGADFITAITGGPGGDPLEVFKKAIADVTAKLNEFDGWVKEHGPQIQATFKAIGDGIMTAFRFAGKQIQSVISDIKILAGGLAQLFGAMATFDEFVNKIPGMGGSEQEASTLRQWQQSLQNFGNPSPSGALGGPANAQRERRGLPPVDPNAGMLGGGGGFDSSFVPGTAGRGYFNSGAASRYLDDQALLRNVPAGVYSQQGSADLTKGLADCSSSIEDLINIIDGQSTAGRSLTTMNASQLLPARGFMPGSMPGAFNIGFNADHMQATLPGGTPFNWGSNSAAARRGIGGTGAFDPAFTQHFYRYASGGGVRGAGSGTSDSIPAMLSHGEHVLSASDVQKMGGQSSVYSFRNALHRANGGAISAKSLQDMRTAGAIPAGAGSTAKAGTSAIAGAIDMGGEVINGIIDQAASAVSTAASAAAMAGSFGAAGPEGGMAAGSAAQFAIGLGTNAAKRGVTYGFDLLGIGADSLLQQLTPFGQPRWLNQDYTGFMPKQAITGALGNLMSGGAQQAADPAGSLLNPKTKEHGTMMGAAPGPIDNLMGNMSPASPSPMISDANSFLSTQSLAAEAPAPNQQPIFKVDNIYTQDVDSLGRELNKQGRLAQMQYTNRPGP
jgi:hypothetical protein